MSGWIQMPDGHPGALGSATSEREQAQSLKDAAAKVHMHRQCACVLVILNFLFSQLSRNIEDGTPFQHFPIICSILLTKPVMQIWYTHTHFIYVYMCIYTYAHAHTNTHAHTYVTLSLSFSLSFVHTCTRLHIHTHIHTQADPDEERKRRRSTAVCTAGQVFSSAICTLQACCCPILSLSRSLSRSLSLSLSLSRTLSLSDAHTH